MPNTLILCVLGFLLSFSTLTAQATFVGSDFGLIVQGYDSNPPFYDNEAGPAYDVWITNNSDQTVVFGENLFGDNIAALSAQINGVALTDSDAYLGRFFPVFNDYGDGVIEPGESYYMGGGVFGFDVTLLPAVSIVELTEFSLRLRNTSPLSDFGFVIPYEGDPVINTITTVPVPAVGLVLVPLIVLMRVFGRRPVSL